MRKDFMSKVSLTCCHCNTEYFKAPSKSKNSKFCSYLCRNRSLSASKKVLRETITCIFCKEEFEKKKNSSKKYCSNTCYRENVKVELVEKNCPVCKKDYKKSVNRQTKFCSRDCLNEAQSSGFQTIPSNGRMGFRKDLNPNYFFKSSLEADYARWCNATNKKYIYEHKTFSIDVNGKVKKYTPDFYHPSEDLYVETKAIRIDKKFEGNLSAVEALKKQGIKINVVTMREFYSSLKQTKHYWLIDNIENKNYLGTRHLIYLKKV
jgi:hypothetical protein